MCSHWNCYTGTTPVGSPTRGNSRNLKYYSPSQFRNLVNEFDRLSVTKGYFFKQECIPVGCVPSATVAVSAGGSAPGGDACSWGVLPLGGSALGGVCSWGGVYFWGGAAPEGCLLFGGGGGISACTLRQTPTPPVNRMTETCKNITLRKLINTFLITFQSILNNFYQMKHLFECFPYQIICVLR